MRLPGFGDSSPLKPGLGGLTGKPAFFEKIGDPGDLTGKIFRRIGISPDRGTADTRKAVLAEPTPVEKQNTKEKADLAFAERNKTGRKALLVDDR